MNRIEALGLRKEYFMPCVHYFYREPPLFVRGEMQYLYDDTGKKYLDFFAGVSVMNCGHSNPFILERVIAQLQKLQHLTNVYLTEPGLLLAERLARVLPAPLHNSFFCMSGSEANEGAMLLARLVTGRRKFIARRLGLHGRTNLTMAATDIPMWRADPFLTGDFYFAETVEEIEALLEQDSDIAALIIEPIQGNAGIRPVADDFFIRLRGPLQKHGVLLIVDEVQSGFARTGKMFAIEHYGVSPDIMAMSKALGNGIPIAAFSASKELTARFTRPSASTLGGNPVSAAAALAVLDYIEEQRLCERAEKLGVILRDALAGLQKKFPLIKEIRGKGLMIGAELERDGKPQPELTDRILEQLKDRGIILGKNGLNRNVLAFQPPLVITEGDIAFLLENLEKALADC
ncbi:aspartate aminotransferase family protein [Spirochaetia bacterium]|nr:aspartate aminotransferase family protein [Spirochaetia bacterium]